MGPSAGPQQEQTELKNRKKALLQVLHSKWSFCSVQATPFFKPAVEIANVSQFGTSYKLYLEPAKAVAQPSKLQPT